MHICNKVPDRYFARVWLYKEVVQKAENTGLAQTQTNKMLGSNLVPLFPNGLEQSPHPTSQSAPQGLSRETKEWKRMGTSGELVPTLVVVGEVGVERIKELF